MDESWLPGDAEPDEKGAVRLPGRRGRYHLTNRLNDRTSTEWLQFQKSWFVLNPKPRSRNVLLHPAKFPEELVYKFVSFFTKPGGVVLDPMAGTGSTLVGALERGRSAIGVELQEKYAAIARERAEAARAATEQASASDDARAPPEADCAIPEADHAAPAPEAGRVTPAPDTPPVAQPPAAPPLHARVHIHDATRLAELELPPVDYCLTSPPYWDMLRADGFETQRDRQAAGLDVAYSDDATDLGNVADYEEFVDRLVEVYRQVREVLRDGAYLTIVVKNIKKRGRIYPLAWDLGRRVGEFLTLKDERIWCQDDQKLAPYGYRYAWVSNTFHHYCLNFRKEPGKG